jgi:serine protease AprX
VRQKRLITMMLSAAMLSAAVVLTQALPAGAADTAVTPDPNPVALSAIGVKEIGVDGRGIDVAVIDTGVVPVPGVPAAQVLYGPDVTPDAFDPNKRNLDTIGHGTNMASLVLDVAPAARIVSVKIGTANSAPSVATIVGAIDWTIANARRDGRNIRVINISFGLQTRSDGGLVAAALRRAWAAGIVVVTAAGNQGNAAATLDSPADDAKFIAVGAAQVAPNAVATFSSGATGLGSRRPDLIAPGVSLVGARVPGSLLDVLYPEARVDEVGFRGSGTSQAAALTSGAVALLLQQRPTLNPDQVKTLLVSTAAPVSAASPVVQGKGLAQVARAAKAATPSKWTASAMNYTWNTSFTFLTLQALLAPIQLVLGGFTLQPSGDWSGNRWSGNRWSGNRWSGDHWE